MPQNLCFGKTSDRKDAIVLESTARNLKIFRFTHINYRTASCILKSDRDSPSLWRVCREGGRGQEEGVDGRGLAHGCRSVCVWGGGGGGGGANDDQLPAVLWRVWHESAISQRECDAGVATRRGDLHYRRRIKSARENVSQVQHFIPTRLARPLPRINRGRAFQMQLELERERARIADLMQTARRSHDPDVFARPIAPSLPHYSKADLSPLRFLSPRRKTKRRRRRRGKRRKGWRNIVQSSSARI